MEEIKAQDLLMSLNNSFESIFIIESLVKSTYEVCQCRDLYPTFSKETISEERNVYINMLKLTLEKIKNLKEQILEIEHTAIS